MSSRKNMEQIILEDGRYPPQAFEFLHHSFEHAVRDMHGKAGAARGGHRHVSGKDLCLALRDIAIQRWGMLARTVLARWNIESTLDFGNMVYLLVENDFMKKTDEDSIEHFRDVYDFAEAFDVDQNFDLKE